MPIRPSQAALDPPGATPEGPAPYGSRRAALKAIAALLAPAFTLASSPPARAQAPAGAPAAAAAARPLRLLALGDSLIAGYGLPRGEGFIAQLEAALRARGRAVTVLNGGVSGDTSAGGRARLAWALADRPDAVLVCIGANDGLRGLDPARTAENLAAILDELEKRGLPVLLSGMHAPPNLGAEYGRAFRAAYEDQARARAARGLVFHPFFLDGVAAEPALNQPDGIHPNAAGVARIVANLLPLVEALLARVARPS
ncbi:MAG: arylesterase [Alphaproteobacteria bacterium]|nr:arylesterase [Alphaproteobacteria bacterium]